MIRKSLMKLLTERKADGYPLAASIALVLLMMLLVITQYAKLMITAAGIKDALQEAVISTVTDNYADVYHAVREGYVAGYQPADGYFVESYRYGDIYGRLDSLLGLAEHDGYHVRQTENGDREYQISALDIRISNNGLASGERYSYEATATVLLEMPVSFLEEVLPDMRITIRTKAAYTPKF